MAAFLALLLGFSMSANPILAQSVTPLEPTPSNENQPSWGSGIDIDPPVIDHEALETGDSGQAQEFRAGVVDDRGLRRVWLFHRDKSGAQYSSVPMRQVEGTSEFVVTIDTLVGQNRIEYYIEAVDTGGNRVLKGFPFFPLVRQLNGVTEPAPPPPVQAEEPKRNTLIYVALGVAAAVGVGLALLSGGGGDDGNDGGNDPDQMPEPGTVPLTIVVSPPEQ